MVFVTSIVIWLLETVKYWLVMHALPLRSAHRPDVDERCRESDDDFAVCARLRRTFEVGALVLEALGSTIASHWVNYRLACRAVVPDHGVGSLVYVATGREMAGL